MTKQTINKTLYYGIVYGKWESIAYALYGYITRKIIFICEDKPLRISLSPVIKSKIHFFQNIIGEYTGEYYKLHEETVQEPIASEELDLEKKSLIQFQNHVFHTNKIENFYKRQLSIFQYEFLRDLFLIRKHSISYKLILPKTKLYKLLAKRYLKDDEYTFSKLLTILYLSVGILGVLASVISGLIIKPVREKKLKGLVLRELIWGFNKKRGFRDNFLVDNDIIKESDFIYYKSRDLTHDRIISYQQATKLKLKTIVLDNKFNVNVCFFKHLKNNIFFSLFYIIQAITEAPYLLPCLAIFLSHSNDSYRLFSFCDVSYYMSTEDYDDIARTIVANDVGVRVFLYHWSDLTPYCTSTHQHVVHNDLFLWGPIIKQFQYRKIKSDNVYCIGCNFSNNYNKKTKHALRKELNLPINKPVVTFFDSSYSDTFFNTQKVYNDFIENVIDYAQNNPKVKVVLKPKYLIKKKYEQMLKKSNVKIFNYQDVFTIDVIRASDLNVSMGMNSATTISLLCGVPALYHDTTGNHFHPLTKYEGQLVFREKETLFKQINDLLQDRYIFPNIPELQYYNNPNADPEDILRKYLKYSKVDDSYLFKG